MPDTFTHDVFLSHSSKDKEVVRPLAERLRGDGLSVWFDEWEIKPGDSIPAKIEEGLERSRVLMFCMSADAFGSEWAQLEAGTFRFRDPLNKERRFIPLRLDDAPIKGSLAQFLYINWLVEEREQAYSKLIEACRPPVKLRGAGITRQNLSAKGELQANREQVPEKVIQLDLIIRERNLSYAFSPDGKLALSGSNDENIRLCNLETGRCLRVIKVKSSAYHNIAWSADQRLALFGCSDGMIRLLDVETGDCLRVLEGHKDAIPSLEWSSDQRYALSGSCDNSMRLWDVNSGRCLRVFKGHKASLWTVSWTADYSRALSGSHDTTIRLWDLKTGRCLRVLKGHTKPIRSVVWSANQHFALSCSDDLTLRLWNVEEGVCLRVFEGHTNLIRSLAWTADNRFVLSASWDKTLRLWDVETGRCIQVLKGHTDEVENVAWGSDQRHAFSGDHKGTILVWDLSEFVVGARPVAVSNVSFGPAQDQVQYTNAKVLLVGDTSSGKTGLAHRLATGEWKPSDGSTVGAWSTQWPLPGVAVAQKLEKEIWLWDFGGQADQRLVHQLYMDRSALILLLFDADKENVLPGLREWQTALRRCVPANTPLILVAGRIDAGFKASRAKLRSFAEEQGFRYFETSAKDGTGCEELSEAITEGIPWGLMEQRTSPRIFKLIKDQILKLRDEGQVLHTFKELRELLWRRMTEESRFTDNTLKTVLGLLDGPGAVKDLDYGTYILLQPEWVNAYAQAVIRTLRQDPLELGCIPLRSIAEGRLLFQSVERDGSILEMKRLPETEERVVLREMERQMEERGLCLRQGDKLVFPSHCGRERPTAVEHPSIIVSYKVKGYLDDIYATLVVKLADSDSFKLKEPWRDAADFDTLTGAHRLGIKLVRESADSGEISVYFGPSVTKQEQVIFANYIHAHLQDRCIQVERLRYYVCPHCHTPKGNPLVLMQKLIAKKEQATVECDNCEKRFDLWDDLEKLFADKAVREQVEGLQAGDAIRLDSRRKGKLLALEVGARITSADQKCFEIPATEDEGIDMELEFTDDDGKGTGKRIYLQLKSGNSHLKTRKKDGVEIFKIEEQRWVEYWLKQPNPVMLVIGTFSEENIRFSGRDKLEFADVRWMEISSYLKRESRDGTKPVKQIEFRGERLDMESIYRWRNNTIEAK
ncbi:MAG: TIR domain-containing protein [Desulfuromonadales bacterium]|nr:TIR domain-containing protein [Desulfuromonadales bacterium]